MTRPLYLAALVWTALTLTALGQKKPATPTSVLSVTVVRDSNGKPVKNAEIVLHPVDEHGKQKAESLELKTHDDGKAETGGVPYGKLRIQVIAKGFKTYGEDYDVQQPDLQITIKLQKPAEQFSIYK
jgi:5-hydroxyisourate hydrolase-like protein (transthyretin family)